MSVKDDLEGDQETERLVNVWAVKILLLLLCVFGGLGALVLHHFWPTFFIYPYLYLSKDWTHDVLRFWPLLACGAGLSCAIYIFKPDTLSDSRPSQDEGLLVEGMFRSVSAGVLEEAWFRGIGVMYAMLLLVVFNWFWGVAGWVVAVIAAGLGVIFFISLFLRNMDAPFLGRLLLTGLAALVVWAVFKLNHDPVFFIYKNILYPIADFMTLKLMHPVFYGKEPAMLIIGMFAANAWFRDGHKYQGLLGAVNSWYAGCVLMFATVNYGIFVAIIVHALYDIMVHVLRYGFKKVTAYRYG
ncbi:MAG: hypothetical protein ABA06_01480 [Parcubacteria bacterium C7867-001]|nr:MAG: hypothetical protein ABA06_01480 [Parcubacteria bacterium C7867-001]